MSEEVGLLLVKLNGEYWALTSEDVQTKLDEEDRNPEYTVELVGHVKMPFDYLDMLLQDRANFSYEQHMEAQKKKLLSREDLNPILAHQEDKTVLRVSCGPDWWPLLIELNKKLEEIDPNYEWRYVKEKYAVLDAWATTKNDFSGLKLYRLLDEYADKSRRICEECGALADGGCCYISGYWEKTYCQLCKEHFGGSDHEDDMRHYDSI